MKRFVKISAICAAAVALFACDQLDQPFDDQFDGVVATKSADDQVSGDEQVPGEEPAPEVDPAPEVKDVEAEFNSMFPFAEDVEWIMSDFDLAEEYFDYANMYLWSSWNKGKDKSADLFFVCPTVDMGKNGIILPTYMTKNSEKALMVL